VPKINAPSVAEHRARQHAALLQAAVTTLIEDGADAVTPAAVTARSGLSRSSFYQYFPSGAALLAAIVEESFTAADQAMARALHDVHEPTTRIDAFVRTELRLAQQGAHRPATALVRAELPRECRQRLTELHEQHFRPLWDALVELDIPDAGLTGELLLGLLQAAVNSLESGRDYQDVAQRTLELIHRGLAAELPASS
jgi:AcrR family transcriptional regulator